MKIVSVISLFILSVCGSNAFSSEIILDTLTRDSNIQLFGKDRFSLEIEMSPRPMGSENLVVPLTRVDMKETVDVSPIRIPLDGITRQRLATGEVRLRLTLWHHFGPGANGQTKEIVLNSGSSEQVPFQVGRDRISSDEYRWDIDKLLGTVRITD